MIDVIYTKKIETDFKLENIFKKIAFNILSQENITKKSEVNVIFVSNKQIQEISKKYRKKDSPTDVLSFPASWQELSSLIGYNMFGDIFISVDKVREQSEKYGHSIKREWCYLFAHGLLHLLGYDHLDKITETEMNNKANEALEKEGVLRV